MKKNNFILSAVVIALAMTACSPIVRVQVPEKPITINLNVTIDQNVDLKFDQDIDELIEENPDIF